MFFFIFHSPSLMLSERNKVPSPNREKNLTFVPGTGAQGDPRPPTLCCILIWAVPLTVLALELTLRQHWQLRQYRLKWFTGAHSPWRCPCVGLVPRLRPGRGAGAQAGPALQAPGVHFLPVHASQPLLPALLGPRPAEGAYHHLHRSGESLIVCICCCGA